MAAAHRVRALALKKTKLGETDLIVTFLARDGSQVRAVAKGARKPGSRIGGRVEPLSVVDMLLYPGRSLYTITEVELVSAHAPLREDLDRAMAAAVVADFLDKVSVEEQGEERLFGLAVATLDAMDRAEGDTLLALLTAFLLKGIAMHGYRPQFSACVGCGEPVGGPGSSAPLRFSLEYGGPLCGACEAEGAAGASGQVVRLSAGAWSALGALMSARMAELSGLEIPGDVLAESFAAMRAYVVYHVPARMKALAMYAAGVA